MAPRVSVLVPAYNAAAYLQEALESVLAQTLPDLELVVVDDGSTDQTLPMLLALARRDPRVVIITRPNTGIVGALQDGLLRCRAPLVARMDADDVADPQRLQRQVAFLDANPEVVVVGSSIRLLCPYGTPLRVVRLAEDHEAICARLYQGDGWALVHPAVVLRREAVERAGGYRARWQHVEDLDLFLRLAQQGRLANLPEPLLGYRQHFGSINRQRAAEQQRKKAALMEEAYAQRGLPPPQRGAILPEERLGPCAQHLLWGLWALRRGRLGALRRHGAGLRGAWPRSAGGLREEAAALLRLSRRMLRASRGDAAH